MTPTAIAAGRSHSLAIGSDGNLYAWGDNSDGELGDGTTTDHDTPEVIALPTGVTPVAIAAGDYHSLVIGSAGPGTGTPEVPVTVALPLLAFGIIGGVVMIRRRRSAPSVG